MIKKKFLSIIFILSVLLNTGLFIILFTPVTELLYKPLIVDEEPQKSEVIVILSSIDAFDTVNGFPDFSTLARLQKGLQLYHDGYADKIICAGGSKLRSTQKSYAQIMKDTLLLYGIPEHDIQIQDDIEGDWNYYKNLLEMVDKFRNRYDFDNSIIVTSSQNTYRIKKLFLKQNINATVVSAEKYALQPSNWHDRFGLFRDVANEYWAVSLFYALGRI
ncbi:MAG: YdcF family protein [Candidatus Scalindua sp. AMX11]|nr:MAG: YdcF family protein [Candidatus Scalindua sp.]NOG82245.1 YdcF family protein [Planctomycetota bacterium]RZV71463.1 MAG: YdcF family protein [Candidatus Scalindua sp. SCAELEC01]TDE64273.1 MAG: YdcF family protein [Candidatus Scalindua sp. AMX11]GJQ59911.1 MAG: hypothetical protein SCALA701_27120 [Candidatus Scalindua sp.]